MGRAALALLLSGCGGPSPSQQLSKTRCSPRSFVLVGTTAYWGTARGVYVFDVSIWVR